MPLGDLFQEGVSGKFKVFFYQGFDPGIPVLLPGPPFSYCAFRAFLSVQAAPQLFKPSRLWEASEQGLYCEVSCNRKDESN